MILEESRVLISTEKLSKTYKLGKDVVTGIKDADIRIMQGEFILVHGLYGKRKNAFFNVIGCVERPTAGKYYFDYEDIALAGADQLDSIRRLKLGYLFRDFKLIARKTVAQNIEVPMQGMNISGEEKRCRLQRVLERFEISSISQEKVGSLSNWQMQKVSLARAAVNSPLMIIADEPAANLDNMEEQLLLEYLQSLNDEGIAIMLIGEKIAVKEISRCRLISFKEESVSEDAGTRILSSIGGEA